MDSELHPRPWAVAVARRIAREALPVNYATDMTHQRRLALILQDEVNRQNWDSYNASPAVTPPTTPSDAAMRAAEEVSSTFGLKFQRDSLHRVAAIITRHLAGTPSPETPKSDDAWREWFDRIGDKASAEVVNATADLVTNERLAALTQAGVLPVPETPVEGTLYWTKDADGYPILDAVTSPAAPVQVAGDDEGGFEPPVTINGACFLCEKGFPIKDGVHYGTQALGMIPSTWCAAALRSGEGEGK